MGIYKMQNMANNRLSVLAVLFIIILLVGFGVEGKAQNYCGAILKKAEKLYEDGNIETIPKMLSGCLNKGLTNEEKKRAYKLIINSYLYSEDLYSAEKTMLEFLKFEPEYETEEGTDKAEFISLYNKFETLPTFSIGLFGGTNFSTVTVINEYSLTSQSEYAYTSGGVGFQVGARFSKTIHKAIDINAEIALLNQKYEFSETGFGFTETNLKESQFLLNIPVSATYKFEIKQFHPFVALGVSGNYLLSASATPSRVYTDNSHQDVTGSDIDMLIHRKKFTLSTFAGLGLRYKIPNGYFFFTTRYVLGLMNQTEENERYNNPELNYQYYYIDNDFKMNNFTFSVGYMYMFYKPEKK